MPAEAPARPVIDFRKNCFDLIRLLAACQVVFGHSVAHLQLPLSGTMDFIGNVSNCFPGVPIFFVISGMLIARSYRNKTSLSQYVANRLLRIYPALWAAFLFAVLLITCFGYWPQSGVTTRSFVIWMVSQTTIFQQYNPSFLRGFGVGVINGALWTISVELQFYIFLPVLIWVIDHIKFRVACLVVIIAASYLIGLWTVRNQPAVALHQHHRFSEYVDLTIAPYLYMFLMGVLIEENFAKILPYLKGRALILLAAYLMICFVCRNRIVIGTNHPNIFPMIVLALFVVSLAYSFENVSRRLLHDNDVSYGVYLYHLLVINAFVQLGWMRSYALIPAVYVLVFLVAGLSWFFIEKKCLKLKTKSLKPR